MTVILPKTKLMTDFVTVMYSLTQGPARDYSIVIDPFAFLPFDPRYLTENRHGYEYYYRLCVDRDFYARVPIPDWSQLCYCDYKLFDASIGLTAQRLALDRFLTNSAPLKLLHISIDQRNGDYAQLLDTLGSLDQWNGLLAINIADRTGHPQSIQDLHMISQRFKLSHLVCLEYYSITYGSDHGYLLDLMDPHSLPIYY